MPNLQITAKKKPVTVFGLFEAATILLVIFSIGTLFAASHRYLELFSHFRFQYFVSSLLLLMIFAIRQRIFFCSVLVGLTILNATFVLPWYVGRDRPEANGVTFKLLHANVYRDNSETAALLAQIDAEDPDLVILQEMSSIWLAALQELGEEYPYSVAEAQDGAFGIGLFSKFPLDDARIVRAPPLDLPEIRAIVRLGEQRINLVSAHPMPPVGRAETEARNAQLRALGDDLAKTSGPTVFVGDLNISMWAPTYQSFENTSGLRNGRKGFGIVSTYPVFFRPAGIPIDHCLVSNGIRVFEFRAGSKIGSDHLPIVVVLSLLAPDSGA